MAEKRMPSRFGAMSKWWNSLTDTHRAAIKRTAEGWGMEEAFNGGWHAAVAATPDRSDDALAEENRRLREALEKLSQPYFWTDDGFSPDASTPAHKETELYRRLHIARAALKGHGL